MSNRIKDIKMYGTSWCADCMRARMFFSSNNIVYEDIDIEENPEMIKIVEEINNGNQSVPTIIITLEDGSEEILVEPSPEELQEFFL